MSPSLSDMPFAFATVPSLQDVPASVTIMGSFREEEGLSIIAPLDQFKGTGITYSGPWAKITLTVHSSLEAVGLTAAIATALAQKGISANVVAAYFHDHVFVRWEDRHAALLVLKSPGTVRT